MTDPFDGECGMFALKCTWSLLKTSRLQIGNSNFLILDRFSRDDDIMVVFKLVVSDLKYLLFFVFKFYFCGTKYVNWLSYYYCFLQK